MFSVIIPLYNKELSIKNTIQSVLDQTFQDFEIVVINDGSTDHSAEIVEQINDPRIRLINQDNQGVSAARNRGIREAKQEWIALLDGDDWWRADKLFLFSKYINGNPDIHWGFAGFDYIKNNKIIGSYRFNTNETVLSNIFESLQKNIFIHTSSLVIKKSFLLRNDIEFLENLSWREDWDLCYKLSIYDKSPLYINQILSKRIECSEWYSLSRENSQNIPDYHQLVSGYPQLNEISRYKNDLKHLDDHDKALFLNHLRYNEIILIYYIWLEQRELPFSFEPFISNTEVKLLKATVKFPKLVKRIIRKLIINGVYPLFLRSKL